jgi:hypothetical protein
MEMFENLKSMRAGEFAQAMKCKPENLQCETAFDLLFKVATRFQSINSFRECLMQKQEDIDKIQSLPIMLLDPSKIVSHKKFKYALEQCPKNPNRKQIYK